MENKRLMTFEERSLYLNLVEKGQNLESKKQYQNAISVYEDAVKMTEGTVEKAKEALKGIDRCKEYLKDRNNRVEKAVKNNIKFRNRNEEFVR